MIRNVYQEEDDQHFKGLKISKDQVEIGGDALKTNITTLGPPSAALFRTALFLCNIRPKALIWWWHQQWITAIQQAIHRDCKLAFEHFCVHAASKTVLDELQTNLELSEENMEPSRMTLQHFGNTSSSSIWYELAYLEANQKIKRGDRTWQLALGSGFKCNSAIWKSMSRVKRPSRNPWLD